MTIIMTVTGNGIGAEGATALAAALRENTSLTALHVQCEYERGSVCSCAAHCCVKCAVLAQRGFVCVWICVIIIVAAIVTATACV